MNKSISLLKHFLPFLTLLVIFLLLVLKNSQATYGQEGKKEAEKGKFVENELLIKFDNEISKSLQQISYKKNSKEIASLTSADINNSKAKNILHALSATEVKSLRKSNESDLSYDTLKNSDRWFLVTIPGNGSIIEKDSPEAKLLEQKVTEAKSFSGVEDVNLNGILQAQTTTPNDTYYSGQWNLPKIHADDAWDYSTGSGTKIAILDTGVYASHSDLSARMGSQMNFAGAAGPTPTPTPIPSDYGDLQGHGTQVAGIAAATFNNSNGIAGVAPNATILNGKVLDNSGSGSFYAVQSGIYWAADNDVDVINMSLGSTSFNCVDYSSMQDAVDYAWDSGSVLVSAAGNSGINDVAIPADCDNVLSVTSSNSSDQWAGQNYGTAVDIVAPAGVYTTINNGSYSFGFGYTSSATPHVSGVAALVKAYNPTFTNSQIVSAITSNADVINGTGTYWSNGRVNAFRAVLGKPSAPTLSIASNGCGNGAPEVAISWDPIPGNNANVTGYNVYRKYSGGSYSYLGTVSGIPNVGFVDTTATGNTNTDYKVTAANPANESDYSNVVNLTTQSCGGSSQLPAPTGLNVTANYCSSGDPIVTLGWNSVSGASSYLVYRKYDFQSQYYYLGATNSTTFNDYTGTGIVEGGNAYYRVMSNNGGGQSGYSNTYFATSQNCP